MIVFMELKPAGCFAAIASQIGATDEEIEAFGRNELPPERIRAIEGRLQFAATSLWGTIPLGRC